MKERVLAMLGNVVLHLHPVKSTAVRPVLHGDVEPWGLAGDRRWMIVDAVMYKPAAAPPGADPLAHAGDGSVPRHVAIIMDGNGRWAKKRFLPRVAGHRKGVEAVRAIVRACGERGVEFGEGGVDDPRVGLGEEDGQSASLAGELVALGAGDPLDEPFAAQAPEVVGHLPRGIAGDQSGDQLAQGAVRQPGEQVLE